MAAHLELEGEVLAGLSMQAVAKLSELCRHRDALDVLIDEHADEGILRRADARLSAARHLYVAGTRTAPT